MPASITPTPIPRADYYQRQLIDKVRPANRLNRNASVGIAIAPKDRDFENAVSFSVGAVSCLVTLGEVSLKPLAGTLALGVKERVKVIIKLLLRLNDLAGGGEVVSAVQATEAAIEERALAIIEARLVVLENNEKLEGPNRWLPSEMVTTVIANMSKAVALVYSLGTPAAHIRALQSVLNKDRKRSALPLLVAIGWHLDRLEEALRPLPARALSEAARMEFDREAKRQSYEKDCTLVVVHPEVYGATFWSLWARAKHELITSPVVATPIAEIV